MLSHQIIGPRGRAVFYVLHGLLGSKRNWTAICKALSAKLPSATFVAVDLRNHGQSTGFAAPHTLETAAADLHQLAATTGLWPSAVIGHSMGGKVALQLVASRACDEFVRRSPAGKLNVWVLDSLPGTTHSDHGRAATDSVARVLTLIDRTPLPIPSRKHVVDAAVAEGLDKGTAMWLASNVTHLDDKKHGEASHHQQPHQQQGGAAAAEAGSGAEAAAGGSGAGSGGAGGFHWLFDPATAASLYSSYCSTDHWPLLIGGPPRGVDVDVVMATRSSRWKDAGERIEAARKADAEAAAGAAASGGAGGAAAARGRVAFHSLQAGHWVHVDNPEGLQAMLMPKLTALTTAATAATALS